MFQWIVKKVIIGKVNNLLEVNQDNVVKTKNTIDTWIGRLQKILDCLKNILSKLDDGKIDSDEIDDSVAEVERVVKEW